jgi:hypothetical protein
MVDRDLFEAVQARLTEQANHHQTARMRSDALLKSRIFDDRGNRMTPSHTRKGGIKYPYYLSSALLQGMAERAGSVSRVPAAEIETLVVKSVRDHLKLAGTMDDRSVVETQLARVEVQQERLIIYLMQSPTFDQQTDDRETLQVAWTEAPSTRRREILLPAGAPPRLTRPIRAESRALLVASIARGRRWLAELLADANAKAESIAKRERCSVRQVNMTISLAFLAPDLVRAAIDGRLAHGIGITRLRDAPAEWSRQHAMLGLPH